MSKFNMELFEISDFYDAVADNGSTDVAAGMCAERANAKLQEWLSKAPLVYGYVHDDGYILMDSGETGSARAKLVCIEDNTKEKK